MMIRLGVGNAVMARNGSKRKTFLQRALVILLERHYFESLISNSFLTLKILKISFVVFLSYPLRKQFY